MADSSKQVTKGTEVKQESKRHGILHTDMIKTLFNIHFQFKALSLKRKQNSSSLSPDTRIRKARGEVSDDPHQSTFFGLRFRNPLWKIHPSAEPNEVFSQSRISHCFASEQTSEGV